MLPGYLMLAFIGIWAITRVREHYKFKKERNKPELWRILLITPVENYEFKNLAYEDCVECLIELDYICQQHPTWYRILYVECNEKVTYVGC